MQKDLHYYAVAAIARDLCLSDYDIWVLANSSQYVDDAHLEHPVNVCLLGHVIPVTTAQKIVIKNFEYFHTTKNQNPFHYYSTNPNGIVEPVKCDFYKPKSEYELGITTHILMDSYSHSGWSGGESRYNKVNTKFDLKDSVRYFFKFLQGKTRPIGHARALDYPDIPGKIYSINNKIRSNLPSYQTALTVAYEYIAKFYDRYNPTRLNNFLIRVIEYDLLSTESLSRRCKKWQSLWNIPEYDPIRWQGFSIWDPSLWDNRPIVVNNEWIKWNRAALSIKNKLYPQVEE
jgi:hypothetical protein